MRYAVLLAFRESKPEVQLKRLRNLFREKSPKSC
jgi:hypothetical protein